MLRSLVLAAALALGVASSPGVRAQECEKADDVIAVTGVQLPGLQSKTYMGADAQKIVAIWNAAPPASDDKADTVVLLRSPVIPSFVGVLLVLDGCITAKGSLPVGEINDLKLSAVRGA